MVLLVSLVVLGGCTINQAPKPDMYTINPSTPSPTPIVTTALESDEDLLNQLNQDSSEPDFSSQFLELETELK